MKILLFLAVVLALIPVGIAAQDNPLQNRPGLSIKETFDLYLKAIEARDVDALMTTVTTGEDFTFLTTRGSKIDSVAGYRQFHVEWFAEENWTMTTEVLNMHEGTDYGYVLSKYHYEGLDAEGNPYKSDSYFILLFHKEEGMWKVIHDQITQIRVNQQ
jgi:ketosteroid isomerase-like protein